MPSNGRRLISLAELKVGSRVSGRSIRAYVSPTPETSGAVPHGSFLVPTIEAVKQESGHGVNRPGLSVDVQTPTRCRHTDRNMDVAPSPGRNVVLWAPIDDLTDVRSEIKATSKAEEKPQFPKWRWFTMN